MKVKSHLLMLLVIVSLLSFVPSRINGQERKAMVRRVTSTTSDGILFSAWVVSQSINSGQIMIVYYRIENRSRKSIYLVRDNTSKVVIEDDNIT